MKKTTYKITAPFRSSMTFTLEAEEGLTHKEICERVTHENLEGAVINWEAIEDSWFDDWNAAYRKESGYVHPWDCTAISTKKWTDSREMDVIGILSDHQKRQQKRYG